MGGHALQVEVHRTALAGATWDWSFTFYCLHWSPFVCNMPGPLARDGFCFYAVSGLLPCELVALFQFDSHCLHHAGPDVPADLCVCGGGPGAHARHSGALPGLKDEEHLRHAQHLHSHLV